MDLLNWTITPAGPVLSHRGTGSGFAYDQVTTVGASTHAAIGMVSLLK
jgi:hypothetical protein